MSIALHGNLSDFGIAEVFQLIGQQRKTGTLIVEGAEGAIFLAFDQGRVVRGGPLELSTSPQAMGLQLVRAGYLTRQQLDELSAESERSARPLADLLVSSGQLGESTLEEVQHLLTREAVFDVMRRQGGDFRFVAESIRHETPPEHLLGAEQILMDGLRMLDEWQTFASAVPGEETVFTRVGDLENARARTAVDSHGRRSHAERILSLVDGRLPVARIIDLSRVGTFEATRALAELRQAGVIDVRSSRRRMTPRVPVRRGPRLLIAPFLRAAMATALPFVVMAGMAWHLREKADVAHAVSSGVLPSHTEAERGRRHETGQIREALAAHALAHSGYPERLEELAERLDSLTPQRLGDYYYAVRADEIVLLAPMD
jgi:hypothetical protein